MEYVLIGVGGLVLGALIMWMIRRPRTPVEIPAALLDPPELVVPQEVAELLDLIRSSAVLVGPHDQVVRSTVQARTLRLVRRTRIAVPSILALVREVRQSRENVAVDLELSRGRGATVQYLSVRVGPLGDDFVVVLADDHSAARRVEETRRDFVANVSHELKTPIGAIALLAEASEAAADDPDAVVRFARRMQHESGRLSELVKQIIDLSRLQSDDPLLDPDEVNLDEVMAGAIDSIGVGAETRGVQLTVAGEQELTVSGDAAQLATAIRNLVHNGVTYSDRGDRVTVGARRVSDGEDEFIDVTVSDNGIGIDQGELQRIFERFYRVDFGRTREQGGTGLGLSIVKHIAAAHGGQVNVWSKRGHGSTFTIRIPAIAERRTPRSDLSVETARVQAEDVESGEDVTQRNQQQEARR